MAVISETITISTRGNDDIHDLTRRVSEYVRTSKVTNGIMTVFVPGSTAGITTIEFEEGVLNDLKQAVGRLIPRELHYQHDARWGDGNGFAHVRAALVGPSLSIPLINGQPALGTWQQVILIDFDNRPRSREIVFQIVGE